MNHILSKDPKGREGSWILILDCPWPEKHVLSDPESGNRGPTFAECANCEYQEGINFEIRERDNDWSLQPFPERLQCGFK